MFKLAKTFTLAILLAALFVLFSTSSVFADDGGATGETPVAAESDSGEVTPTDEPPTTETPVAEETPLPQETTADPLITEEPLPTEPLAVEETPFPEESLPLDGELILADEAGDPLVMASEETAALLQGGDPYFMVGTQKYAWVFDTDGLPGWQTDCPAGTTPGTIVATVNPAGLVAGHYSGTITISAAGAINTITIPVSLTVGNAGAGAEDGVRMRAEQARRLVPRRVRRLLRRALDARAASAYSSSDLETDLTSDDLPPQRLDHTRVPELRGRPIGFGPVRELSSEPPVFLCGIPYDLFQGFAPAFGKRYGHRPAGFLIVPTWSIEHPDRVAALVEGHHWHTERFPEHRLRYLCNSEGEADLLRAHDLPADLLNHKCTVSDEIFRPLPDVEVEFDAGQAFKPNKADWLDGRWSGMKAAKEIGRASCRERV